MKKIILLLFLTFFSTSLILAQKKKDAKTLIHEGVELHDQKEYKKAIKKYQQALKLDSGSTQATYEMALSYLKLDDYKRASKYSMQVIQSNDPQLSVGAYAIQSEALAEMGKVDEAIAILTDGVRKIGNEYLLEFNLALNYYKKNDLDKSLLHVRKAIDITKSNSGAFLLQAYILNDKKLWVQSILSFQMFLLLEPDSKRSKSAFEEMVQTMRIKQVSQKPVKRSFIQQQLLGNKIDDVAPPKQIPPLSIEEGLNRNFVYHAITTTLDSIKSTHPDADFFYTFKEVNKAIIEILDKENDCDKTGVFWTFYIPFFSRIVQSKYYDTYARYISVSYFPESLEWWNEHADDAKKFILWFEKGEESPD